MSVPANNPLKIYHQLEIKAGSTGNSLYNKPYPKQYNNLSIVGYKQNKADTVTMSDITQITDSNQTTHTNDTQVVNELPSGLIKSLMKIAETCVIKSNRISQDETPDFVQNCLLKLLLQVEQQRVVVQTTTDGSKEQYFILKKDQQLLEIEKWFGTAAINISIDRYRRIKNQVDIDDGDSMTIDKGNEGFIFAPEPSANLEEDIRESKIQEMAEYCASALDDCLSDSWEAIANENYHNFTLSFNEKSTHENKGIAVANYCHVIIGEKYSNDGKKVYSHDLVCDALGIHIKPENIAHKKKKFEKLVMSCINKKVDEEFNHSTKDTLQEV